MEQRKFRMPTAYTILFCLILLVAPVSYTHLTLPTIA